MLELKVTLDNLLTFVGLLFVAWQMRDGNQQRKIESEIRMYDINRELIAMGFDKPELFEILKDTNKGDSELERWYLQLWLNQLSMFHSLKAAGALQKDYEKSCERDLRDMFEKANMRRHWKKFGKFYPTSFQTAIDAILHEAGQKLGGERAEKPKR